MITIRTMALGAAAAAMVAAASLPAAGAAPGHAGSAPADTYGAEATASALRVSLFGQQLTVGSGTADVTSPDAASAEGTGALLATQGFGTSRAVATGAGSSDGSATPTCSPLALPPSVPVLDLTVACSTAEAAVTATGARSSASGKSLELTLGGDPLVQPVLDALPIATITDALIGGLAPLFGVVAPAVPPELVADQLNELLNDALTGDGVALLKVEAGEAGSQTSSDADSVDAATHAAGATIKIIDRGGDTFGTQPVLTIVVGESTTTISRDRASGATTAEQTAVPARVTVADDIAFLLSLPENSFEVPQGQQVDLPLPAPLTSSIKLSGGSTSELADGAKAESATVELNLLGGVNGGVQVGLSSGSSSVVGTVAVAPATAAPGATPAPAPTATGSSSPGSGAPAPRTVLPRTGTEEQPLREIALALGLSAAGVGGLVVRSSRRSRASGEA